MQPEILWNASVVIVCDIKTGLYIVPSQSYDFFLNCDLSVNFTLNAKP